MNELEEAIAMFRHSTMNELEEAIAMFPDMIRQGITQAVNAKPMEYTQTVKATTDLFQRLLKTGEESLNMSRGFTMVALIEALGIVVSEELEEHNPDYQNGGAMRILFGGAVKNAFNDVHTEVFAAAMHSQTPLKPENQPTEYGLGADEKCCEDCDCVPDDREGDGGFADSDTDTPPEGVTSIMGSSSSWESLPTEVQDTARKLSARGLKFGIIAL